MLCFIYLLFKQGKQEHTLFLVVGFCFSVGLFLVLKVSVGVYVFNNCCPVFVKRVGLTAL